MAEQNNQDGHGLPMFMHQQMQLFGAQLVGPPGLSIEEIKAASKEELMKVQAHGYTQLRLAIKAGAPLEIVKLLIDRCPEAFTVTDKHGNAVVSGLSEFTPPQVGILVAEMAPIAAFLQIDADGDSPLHCIIQNRAPSSFLVIVIQRSPPEVFATVNKEGKLPIHEAVRYGMQVDIFRLLLSRSPQGAMGTPDMHGRLPIHCLTDRTSTELADAVIDASPSLSFSRCDADGQLPLHRAVSIGVAPETLRTLIGKAPAALLSVKDKHGGLPLHKISGRLSSSAVQALVLLSNKDALLTPDNLGRLPIHCYLEQRNVSVDILTFLIDQAPRDCLSVTDNEGCLPLHTAIQCHLPLTAVMLLVNRSSEDAMSKTDNNGRIPVMLAALKSAGFLELIQLLTSKTPHQAILCRDEDGQNLMHCLVKSGGRADVLAYMANTAPELLVSADATGKLPIHSYFGQERRRRFERGPLQALLDGSPESLLMADADGMLPLHYASSCAPSEIVKVFTDHPSGRAALLTANKKGQLPLHLAVIYMATVETIMLLMDREMEAMFQYDNFGHLPLYYAITGKPGRRDLSFQTRRLRLLFNRRNFIRWQVEVVTYLVDRHGGIFSICDELGRLPLHDAVESGAGLDILKLLIQAYPDAAKHPDIYGRLPLHSALEKRRPWDGVKVILDAFPGAACETDVTGEIPLFVACKESADLSTIFSLMVLNPSLLAFEGRVLCRSKKARTELTGTEEATPTPKN